MASEEESVSISQFTSTAESADVSEDDANFQTSSWADDTPEDDTPLPDALKHLVNNGLCFQCVPFWSSSERPRLVKNLSVYFSVDTVVTNQEILEAFD